MPTIGHNAVPDPAGATQAADELDRLSDSDWQRAGQR
jgi:hypothetical protein